MQKVFRINLNSRNAVIKRARREVFHKRKSEEKDYEQWLQVSTKKSQQYIKDERKARREDWIAGPLAPDRDTGTVKGALGAMDPILMQRKELPAHILKGPRESEWVRGRWRGIRDEETWQGKGNEGNIVVGDRVCVMTGPAKGQIGMVKDVLTQKGEVVVGDVNTADVELPAFMNPKQTQGKKFNSMEVPVPIDSVRLVYRMDFADGREEDVIIRHLRGGAPHHEPTYGSNRPWHTRYIAGTETAIEWPEEEVVDYPTEAMDTVRKDVDEYGYMPSIYEWPLPEGVEDELMPKYSKKRTTHEEEYIARKILDDARSKWYERRRLVSPNVEAVERKRAVKKAHGLEEEEVWDLVKREMMAKRLNMRGVDGVRNLQSSAH